MTNGDKYWGTYENGVFKHGRVEFKYYVGEMVDNKKHGKGKTQYSSNEYHEGSYEAGLKHGLGKR